MARKRTKKRTHVGANNPETATAGHASARDPKSMVIRIGAGEVGSNISQLAADVRKVMEPGTASRLKERRGNRLRDYAVMCGPLGVTHMLLFSRSESGNTNLRVALAPRGPTLNFRVEQYSLCKDLQKAQRHPKGGGKEYVTPPLLVMNNFTRPDADAKSKVPKHLESLTTTVFQSLFPPINPQATPLKSIRRVLLLNREQSPEDDGTFILNFRHYAITTRSTGLSKQLRRINAAEQFMTTKTSRKSHVPNLGKLEDIADYMIGEGPDGYVTDVTSGSEIDTDAEVEVLDSAPRKVLSAKARQAAAQNGEGEAEEEENVERRAVKLVELGPRMRLRLTKVEEGLCSGKVMWHEYVHKSKEEIKELEKRWEQRRQEKEKRRKEQKANVEKKKATKTSKRGTKREEGGEEDEDEDDYSDMDVDEFDSEGLAGDGEYQVNERMEEDGEWEDEEEEIANGRAARRVTARLPGQRPIHPRLSRRRYASQAPPTAPVALWAGGALLAGGAGLWYLNGSDAPAASVDAAVPAVAPAVSVEDIAVVSPVKVLSLQEADQKLREQMRTFTFDGRDGAKGRIDVVRVASNSPVEDEWAVGVGRGVGEAKTVYAGVYDGHAGWATSRVLKETLIAYVSTFLGAMPASSSDAAVTTAIQDAFTALDARIMGTAQRAVEAGHEASSPEVISALAPASAGSCALLTAYDTATSTLRTAVAGDSRAVLGSWCPEARRHAAEPLSVDQTGFNDDEVARLDAEHPGEKDDMLTASTGRLLGMAVTRAFGDHRWKWPNDLIRAIQQRFYGFSPRPQSKTPPYMTARPEVTTRHVQAQDFVILASDGLWDFMDSDAAVACVERWLAARRAGAPESLAAQPCEARFEVDGEGYSNHKAAPETFAIEDLDNAAVCLVKNALGGRRRVMFRGAMTAYSPLSRYVRDDMTVQVIFFKDPYATPT
ncbi:hypothetical protein S7711_01028 [Stachybotrys chartarum IBT 7711]|uniref:Brix domain-containing protein n=1 Tax=Stachybotrys chartarum (strain CBS 109288 / IBT 7711) TaxID=1280523 RepID=A0A084B467_STACB|nr:hypothetical protein S7711_01028 [Stachybotrys chartarum IBT 7711]